MFMAIQVLLEKNHIYIKIIIKNLELQQKYF